MKYIDADKLREAVEGTTWYHIFNGRLVEGANSQAHEPLYKASDIYKVLDNADVAEVVRCKDCKHSRNDEFEPLWCYVSETCDPVKEDHFCGYGERRDE